MVVHDEDPDPDPFEASTWISPALGAAPAMEASQNEFDTEPNMLGQTVRLFVMLS